MGTKGMGLLPEPLLVLLEAQDVFDEPIFPLPQGVRIIGSLREKDNEFRLLKEVINETEGLQALNGLDPVNGDCPREAS